MPNSDTWPRAVSVETLNKMDSARSCDSVISVNSACSEDSMEHLSAEEKACLMYLEETIESLDLQEDSGFSNDEPDPTIRRIKRGGAQASPQPAASTSILTVLARSRNSSGANESENQSSQVSSTPDIIDPDLPSHIPPDPTATVAELASGSATPVPAQETDGDPPNLEPSVKSNVDLSAIPPPSDFMDEPVSPPATSAPVRKPTINLEVLRRRVSEKNMAGSGLSAPPNPISVSSTRGDPSYTSTSPAPPISVSPPPPSSINVPPLSVTPTPMEPSSADLDTLDISEPPPSPSTLSTEVPSVAMEPKSPPAVAPKPKKLPPNIILKSHKSAGVHESIASPNDRVIIDPQKARMEALRKLGLLKSEDSDSGPALRPLQSRRSWAPASSPLSPISPKTPPPSAPYTVTTHVPSEPLPDIIPVPAAFSDPVTPPYDDVFAGDRGSPLFEKKLISEGGAVKSATLERSGLGLSTDLKQQSLNQLRNSRPRPASLGSGKDFSGERPTPAPSHSDSSQRLPRSEGISVLISPGEKGQASRRLALKKLGLLRE